MTSLLTIVDEVFRNANDELAMVRDKKITDVSSALNIHVVSERFSLCQKLLNESKEEENYTAETNTQNTQMVGYSNFPSEQYSSSPHDGNEMSMYNLTTFLRGHALWTHALDVARQTCGVFIEYFNKGLPSSVESSLAKFLNNLVLLNDARVNEEMHKIGLIPTYLDILEKRSTFDMFIIHIVPAISFILRDVDASRAKICPLTKDWFGWDVKIPENIINFLLLAKVDIPSLDIYATILHDVIHEVSL
ncbi:hypothetical protein PsorP6_017734 [Peronosclerospora sorghi]|uniref:Uncharacterized protein n=1 Tax=Peronosclerospora sorghi TaxID=230839 RepID=A0ACC0WMQ0_9STRA|nr:hypothetical protein PsorP6_017734 [Peronosclerospora sorghi]